MIGWHTFKPTCRNTACIVTEINQFTLFLQQMLLHFSAQNSQVFVVTFIFFVCVRILTLQLAYHGALTVDLMSYAGKWSKQAFNTQCVFYSTRSVCLSVCLSTSY